MAVLLILGILAVLLVLLCLTRVGVRILWQGGSATVDVKLSVLRFRVYPGKEAAKEPSETKKISKSKQTGEKRSKPALADLQDAFRTIWPPLKAALSKTCKGIKLHPFTISLTLGGAEDPPSAAALYGYLNAGMWTAMPRLEEVLDIPKPQLHVGLDFGASKNILDGEVGVSARVGTLLGTVFRVGIPVLRWFLRYQKKIKQQASAAQAVV